MKKIFDSKSALLKTLIFTFSFQILYFVSFGTFNFDGSGKSVFGSSAFIVVFSCLAISYFLYFYMKKRVENKWLYLVSNVVINGAIVWIYYLIFEEPSNELFIGIRTIFGSLFLATILASDVVLNVCELLKEKKEQKNKVDINNSKTTQKKAITGMKESVLKALALVFAIYGFVFLISLSEEDAIWMIFFASSPVLLSVYFGIEKTVEEKLPYFLTVLFTGLSIQTICMFFLDDHIYEDFYVFGYAFFALIFILNFIRFFKRIFENSDY